MPTVYVMAKQDRKIIKKKLFYYADAILNLAMVEGGTREALRIRSDFEQICIAMLTNSDYLTAINDSEYMQTINQYSDAEMKKVINTMYKGISESLMKILEVVAENRDMSLLVKLAKTYEWLLEHWLCCVVVDVTTVVELDDNLRQLIKDKASNDFGCDVILHEHINKDILGGVILEARNKTIDASIISQLRNMKTTLMSSHNKA